jgi:hypothetical protein
MCKKENFKKLEIFKKKTENRKILLKTDGSYQNVIDFQCLSVTWLTQNLVKTRRKLPK